MGNAPPSRLELTLIMAWSRFHRFAYRTTGGRVLSTMRGKPALLLTTTGRRTGRPRTVPLPFLADRDTMIVVGSNSGAPRHPDWVLNLMAQPLVSVQYRAISGPARAEILAGDEHAATWQRVCAQAPWYAGYQQRTSRQIPVIRLIPQPVTLPAQPAAAAPREAGAGPA